MIDQATIIRFLMQLGLAVAGAASLWSVFFHYQKQKTTGDCEAKNLEMLTGFLMALFSFGLLIFVLSWAALKDFFYIAASFAHEGIIVKATADYIQNGLIATLWPVYALVLLGAVLIYIFQCRKNLFNRYGIFLFSAGFLLISLIDVFILYVGSFNKLQFFYFLHHWHSIFTLGTVITVDYLYVRTIKEVNLKRSVYPLFPFLSAVIWAGLGLDFLSNLLIFKQAFVVNPQFLFIQTVIAIIILNGATLSDRINKRLLAAVQQDHPRPLDYARDLRPLSQKEERFLGLSGAVSITSWLTIAFVDLFVFDLKYGQFLTYYLLAILMAFAVHRVLTKRSAI